MKTQTKQTKSFKERYNKLNTIKDGQDLLASMPTEELIEMRDAMQVMLKYTGLDMREEFLFRQIPYEIESRAMKVAPVQDQEIHEEKQLETIKSHMYDNLDVLKDIEVKDDGEMQTNNEYTDGLLDGMQINGIKQGSIDHLRRLIQCWKDNGLIEDQEIFDAIKDDIETFINLEGIK